MNEIKPRPTCGTCPHWDQWDDNSSGYCTFWPRDSEVFVSMPECGWCGQHPDMPAWIKTEWPKLRAQLAPKEGEETIERRDKFMAEYAKEKENGS